MVLSTHTKIMVSADDKVSSETQKRHLVLSATLYQQPLNNMKFLKVVKITPIHLLTLITQKLQ